METPSIKLVDATVAAPSGWHPQSWRSKQVAQDVVYDVAPTPISETDAPVPDPVLYKPKKSLSAVVDNLSVLPPLVSAVEIERLKAQLAKVAKGDAFLLQGGDCAELFDYCTSEKIEHRLSLLLSMSLILIWGMRKPVVRIARMGGQYAKPRSKQTEVVDGKEIPSFRGHNVNGISPDDRLPDPERLLSAYFHSAATVNHVRALLASGFASLLNANGEDVPWSLPLSHVRSPDLLKSYERIVAELSSALEFLGVVGGDRVGKNGLNGALESVDIFMSHEVGLDTHFMCSVPVLIDQAFGQALMLEYESALTRELYVPSFARTKPGEKAYYCTSAWVRDVSLSELIFFRGLRNPVGIKVGPTSEPAELVRLLGIVDPDKEPGRVTLITRYGANLVDQKLPAHIEAVSASGHPVVWCCDPMHGNTRSAAGGIKTRAMHDIVSEISSALRIHQSMGSNLGGIHLELTGDIQQDGQSVTECTGGSMELGEHQLALRFESFCDPRLNFEQSLDVAFMLSQAGNPSRGRVDLQILKGLTESRPSSVSPRR
ncbi:BZ3500_MvSof-1268-A1-R1_Chr4-4g07527 [Microbotryum saponariae]|uniref:Phospho-2-dehydro-3-deoxyheptonate aldolase n=1 Tax=Microbotryum saponariae TaxID=289078 RepID=A0A2X0LPA9_9BASI|nr:BZ3500_MvSof-1268-A1-R1_Chr4-4g07527 [Microbotryum saponariae]SDA07188.1 BZ3501_MvSof-1269-A2-R1_Chr4-3g07235 [Microbotryum saponariae]